MPDACLERKVAAGGSCFQAGLMQARGARAGMLLPRHTCHQRQTCHLYDHHATVSVSQASKASLAHCTVQAGGSNVHSQQRALLFPCMLGYGQDGTECMHARVERTHSPASGISTPSDSCLVMGAWSWGLGQQPRQMQKHHNILQHGKARSAQRYLSDNYAHSRSSPQSAAASGSSPPAPRTPHCAESRAGCDCR